MFDEMLNSGVAPNEFTYLYILGAITNLNEGHIIHSQLMVCPHFTIFFFQYWWLAGDVWRACSISCYSFKYDTPRNLIIFHIFTEYKHLLKRADVITWTIIIQAHSTNGQSQKALQFYHEMKACGVSPDEHTFAPFWVLWVN